MSSPQMVPMITPDGQHGDVPVARVQDAVKAGFKVGQDMLSPNGSQGVIPLDRVHDAIAAGFQLAGAPPRLPDVGNVNEGIPKSGRTGKALVPSMGGPPMLMDVPEGSEVATEQTAQEGYQTGAKIGLASLPVVPAGEAGSYGAGYGAEALNAMLKAHPYAGPGFENSSQRGALWRRIHGRRSRAR
jgi:hypothetical protein